jgi:hypothetical protein
MTDTARPTALPQVRADYVVIALVVVLAVAALAYVMSQRQQDLRRSPVGLDGLQVWLTAQGGSAQTFSGGWMLDPASVGLLVLPLHDTLPDAGLVPGSSKQELIFQQDEVDQSWQAIAAKLRAVPTLVVLPKWRSGMRLTGIAHPALLVDRRRIDAMLMRLTAEPLVRLTPGAEVFTRLEYQPQNGAAMRTDIYAAQLFDGTKCDPVIGSGKQTLLAWCPSRYGRAGEKLLILSDPDLLNNHGLRLGQNAAIARDVLLGAAQDATVLIDYSLDDWFTQDDAPVQRERTWADFLRFFEPPFLTLWLGAGALLALGLWRSFRRAEPLMGVGGAASAKMQAIKARARLMRLTGQDGAMIGDYAAARIAATAARLVGPGHARQIGEERAFVRFVARARPDLAQRLDDALTRARALPRRVPAAVALHTVDELEQILEQIAHDA